MTPFVLPVRYHQQDASDFCGEAVVQMIVASQDDGIVDQSALRSAHGGSSGTTADEACDLLNGHVLRGERFAVRGDPDPKDGMRRIVETLTATRTAVAVPIYGGTHWVAVTGAVLDGDPRAPEIRGLFVNNPEPPAPPPPPNPHSDADPCGAVTTDPNSQFGSANTFVSTFEWLGGEWRKPAPYDGQDVFVTVGRGDATEPGLRGAPVLEPPRGSLEPRDAAAAANLGVAAFALDADGSPLAAFVRGAGAGPHDVFPVTRIPRQATRGSAEPYHIVSMRRGGDVVALARIGSQDGRFLSLQAPPAYLPAPDEMFDFASAAMRRWQEETMRRGDVHDFTVHPSLVWRPSLQSMSPFYPFAQINVAGRILYAGMNGRIYLRLVRHPVTVS